MADPQFPLINGFYPSFASIELVVNDKIKVGVKSITYSQKLENGDVYGTSPQQMAKTRGKLIAVAGLELYLAQYYSAIANLGAGYMEKAFNVLIHFSPPGLDLMTDEIV